MLYVGFFRFEFDDPQLGRREAEFSYLIAAENVDEATERMAEQIMANHQDILQGTDRLMLDDLVEILQVPDEGLILKVSHAAVSDGTVFHHVLPNNDSEDCSNYRQGPDPAHDPEGASEYEPQPFLLLEDADDEEGDDLEAEDDDVDADDDES
jgi:hypothetical protein